MDHTASLTFGWRQQLEDLGLGLRLVFREANRDGLLLVASALAYVSLLSLIPLLASFSFIGTRVFDRYSEQILAALAELLPYSEQALRSNLATILEQAEGLRGPALLGLFVGGFFTFGAIDDVINRIWKTSKRRSLRARVLSFSLLLVWGPLLIGIIYSSLIVVGSRLAWSDTFEASLLAPLVPFFASLLGLTLLFWLVPNTQVHFRNALTGGAVAAILLELLRTGFGYYVEAFSRVSVVYGSLAFLFFFAISIQLSWAVVLLGCEIAFVRQSFLSLSRDHQRRRRPGRWLGLAAITEITRRFTQGSPRVEDESLANVLAISPAHLGTVLDPLIDAGFVGRSEAPSGYQLQRPPHQIVIADLLDAVDDASELTELALPAGLAARLDQLALRVETSRRAELKTITLAELISMDDVVTSDQLARPFRPEQPEKPEKPEQPEKPARVGTADDSEGHTGKS